MNDSAKSIVATNDAPKAVGPYSQAVVAGGFVFCSGQIPLEPSTMRLIESEDVTDHVRRVMENLRAVLSAAGSDFAHVVKTTIFVRDLADFADVNRAYAAYFPDAPPARSTVQAAALPLGARVEVELIARLPA
jgi:2-iminobutanoate/2-iminopropanoate deaminase